MFEISNLEPRMVHDDFERAAQDLERMLLLREPMGRVLNEFEPANTSRPGLVPRRAPRPPKGEPAWTSPSASPAARPARVEVKTLESARVEPRPDPQPVERRRPRRSRQFDPGEIFRW
jgi:hypothetical protein